MERRLAEAGIRRRWWKISLTETSPVTPDQERALRAAQAYVSQDLDKHDGRGLGFFGPPGTGKTHLAVGIARAVIEQGHTVCWLSVPDWLDDLRRAIRAEAEDPNERAFAADLVVLDDLGAEYVRRSGEGTAWAEEQVYRLVNRRYEDMRPLVVTSNCALQDLPSRVGARVASRLLEMVEPILLSGPDARRVSYG